VFFPTIRHNKLHDVTAKLLSQDIQIEPHLQPLSGETLAHCTSNFDDQAKWISLLKAFGIHPMNWPFFDVQVFNPLAKSHVNSPFPLATENMKMKKSISLRKVQRGTFTPLVFSAASGMGPIATTYYEHLASLLVIIRQFDGFVAA